MEKLTDYVKTAEAAEIPPERVARARHVLGGPPEAW